MSTNPDRIVLWILIGVVGWLVYLHFAVQSAKYEPLSGIYAAPSYDASAERRLNDRIDCLAERDSNNSLGLRTRSC